MDNSCVICECNNCWCRVPEGTNVDCHYCECCLESKEEIIIGCENYQPIKEVTK